MAKRPVSRKNRVHFFILLSHSFTWNWQIKIASFVTNFWEKVEKPRAASFNFFPPESDSFNILSEYQFHETLPKNLTFFKNLPQNLPFFTVSFQVKPCENKIKKWTQFMYETGLLADFCKNWHFQIVLFLTSTNCRRPSSNSIIWLTETRKWDKIWFELLVQPNYLKT